jgi:hypothetical protein
MKRLLLSSLLLLAASNVCQVKAKTHSRAAEAMKEETRTEQADAPLSVELVKGALQIKTPDGPVLTNLRLRLRLADGASLAGTLEEAGREASKDGAGEFERLRFRLKPAPHQEGGKESVSAVLEVRRYARANVVVASLDYEGPPLAATDGVQLLVGFDSFARGMALKQLKLYWTAPVFVSDQRLLSPSNQLLLWRQTRGRDFNLLVPLAGGGMVSTVGVADVDYRYEFRVAASSYDPAFSPRRVPLFAYSAGADPYRLPRDTYQTAFTSTGQYGRLRWEKPYPEVFRWLGWCSWNTYYQEVSEEKVIGSVRSLREHRIPFGFVLVDDGWLSVRDNRLAGFDADPRKFPHGMSNLARVLRDEYHVPHVGVWHTFEGYWDGVDASAGFAPPQELFKGVGGKSLPDPREGRGEEFYAEWYSRLKSWGYDFVKVDGQSNIIKFTTGLMPLFDSGRGEQQNFQEAAASHFGDAAGGRDKSAGLKAAGPAGLNVINCMEMTLEHAFNWRLSNVARNSDDYLPDSPQNAKEHVFQNAYNAYWTANFAYPDWDMFQSHDPSAEFHAAARAVSGGPVYFTDEPGKEHPEILRRLTLSDGRLLLADQPAQVTRDLLLTDPSLEAVPLKVFNRVTRPGLAAGVVAAFNVNKSAPRVAGQLYALDADVTTPGGDFSSPLPKTAVYRRSDGSVTLLDPAGPPLAVDLSENGFDLFTLVPVEGGVAVFGLLDKYLSPAAVVSVKHGGGETIVRLREGGAFGAWTAAPPARVEVDGRALPSSQYSYDAGLLRVPAESFGGGGGEREVKIVLTPGAR